MRLGLDARATELRMPLETAEIEDALRIARRITSDPAHAYVRGEAYRLAAFALLVWEGQGTIPDEQ